MKNKGFAVAALLVGGVSILVPLAWAQSFELAPMVDGNIQRLNDAVQTFEVLNSSGLVWQRTIRRVGADYLRIHFTGLSNPEAESFRLRVLDSRGAVVLDRGPESVSDGDFWTPVIYGSEALIQIHASPPPEKLTLVVKEVAYQKSGGGWRSLIGPDQREQIFKYADDEDITRASRAVAKLSFVKDGLPYVCTGFMIAADKLMTNHHCVASQEVCGSTVAIFGYQYDEAGVLNHGTQYECDEVVSKDSILDYSILRLRGAPGSLWGELELSTGEPQQDQQVYIVQHPAGEPKQISRVDCRVSMAVADGLGQGTDAAHVCDTLGGSSGSPVLDLNHRVVGLHHFGVGQGAFWNQNRAVRMSRIRLDAGL